MEKPFIADRMDFIVGDGNITDEQKRNAPPLCPFMPEAKLFVPESRNKPVDEMWSEKYQTPHKQTFGVAFFGPIPKTAGNKYTRFQICGLSVHKNEARANSERDHIREKHPEQMPGTFRMGMWHVLPVPVWLETESEQVEYARTCISYHMNLEKRKTKLRQDLVKRRSKLPVGTKPFEAHEEATLLEPDDVVDPPIDEEEKEKKVIKFKELVFRKHAWGLMSVLPEVQNPNQSFEFVCFNWIGAYKSRSDAEHERAIIQPKYPEWQIFSFKLGEPLDLPVPVWLFKQEQFAFDQRTMKDFMSCTTNGPNPEELNDAIDLREETFRNDPHNANLMAMEEEDIGEVVSVDKQKFMTVTTYK